MNPTQKTSAFVVLAFFFAVYITPVVGATIACALGSLTGETFFGKLFVSLLASPTGSAAVIQKILFPLTAGISIAVMWSEKFERRTILLLALVAVAIACSLFLMLYLDGSDEAKDLYQMSAIVKSAEQFQGLKDQYLSSTLESLATYLLVLLGLQTIPTPTP